MIKTNRVEIIPINLIQLGKRARKDLGDMDVLRADIAEKGLIQPIAVKQPEVGFKQYTVLAGGRRLQCCKDLKHTEIQVRIYSNKTTDKESAAIELAENIYRKDLTWAEKDLLKLKIHDTLGEGTEEHTQQKTAEILGDSKAKISMDLQMARAIKVVPELAECKTEDQARKVLSMMKEELIANRIAEVMKEQKAKTPAIKILSKAYKIGNFLNAKLPVKHFDVVEFDPPYLNLDLESIRRDSGVKGFATQDAKEYTDFVRPALKKCFDAMRDNAWILLWTGIESVYFNTHLLTKAGFQVNKVPAIWLTRQHDCRNPSVNLANAYDVFIYGRKGNAELAKARTNCYDYKIVSHAKRTHKAEAPIEMMEDVLSTFGKPGANLLVPCTGSGNSLIAGYNVGYAEILGFDTEKVHHDNYMVRIAKEEFQSYNKETQ